MSLGHGAKTLKIVKDGLQLHLDTDNPACTLTGDSLRDLSGNNVTATLYNYTELNTPYSGYHLNDDTGRIQLSTISNITTVELWVKVFTDSSNTYLLDMRTGGTGGWIYQRSTGSNWTGGKLYINGQYVEVIGGAQTIATIESYVGQYIQIVVTAVTSATDDITLFSRYSANESMVVDFHAALVYNRELTSDEIAQNFEARRARYGI